MHSKNDVHWCAAIPSFPVLQEAKFSAVYGFDIDAEGRPVKIERASVPFISKKDKPLIDCIASWHLPPSKGKATATFHFEWAWKGAEVRSGDFAISVSPSTSKPVTH
jgi:hypothetical protein